MINDYIHLPYKTVDRRVYVIKCERYQGWQMDVKAIKHCDACWAS